MGGYVICVVSNFLGREHFRVQSSEPLPGGDVTVTVRWEKTGDLIRVSAAAHGLVRTPRPGLGHTAGMKTTVMNPVKAFTFFALALAIAAMGIDVADADVANIRRPSSARGSSCGQPYWSKTCPGRPWRS